LESKHIDAETFIVIIDHVANFIISRELQGISWITMREIDRRKNPSIDTVKLHCLEKSFLKEKSLRVKSL